ncbi:MAG: hypothetical protein IPP90_21430 [Gemmatimonadaceae bacterium]|nr:hypothetical protein [Gemmatimonadaceae bacterium]
MTVGRLVHRTISLVAATLSIPSVIGAQPLARSGPVPHDAARERAMLDQVKVPEGFTATLFAAPPVAMYPVCLTGTVDGAVFVCVDPNLSLTAAKGKRTCGTVGGCQSRRSG